jgi:predicted RNA-binding protein with TRAM domain
MELPAALCLFTGRVEERDGEYVITVPQQEVDLGTVEPGESYRVGMYPGVSAATAEAEARRPAAVDGAPDESPDTPLTRGGGASGSATTESRSGGPGRTPDQPPVSEGETLQLQIEDVGDQGDGLARVGPGYVVFVPDTEIGQQPLVRITAVRENFAFAEVVEQ